MRTLRRSDRPLPTAKGIKLTSAGVDGRGKQSMTFVSPFDGTEVKWVGNPDGDACAPLRMFDNVYVNVNKKGGKLLHTVRVEAWPPLGGPRLCPRPRKMFEPEKRVRKSGYRPWAELLERTFLPRRDSPSLPPVLRSGSGGAQEQPTRMTWRPQFHTPDELWRHSMKSSGWEWLGELAQAARKVRAQYEVPEAPHKALGVIATTATSRTPYVD